MKKGFNIIIVLSVVMFMFAFITSASFAMPNDMEEEYVLNLDLYDNKDSDVLKNDLYNYIDLVDNIIIPNATYEVYDKLSDNYDFLTKFAISLILDNSEYYDIIIGDNYIYRNEYGIEYSTNKYVSIDTIYEITNSVFGIDYYYIVNDYLDIKNDLVPLLEIDEHSFDMDIDSITNIIYNDDYIDVYVKYIDMDIEYIYRFIKKDSRLVISNLII